MHWILDELASVAATMWHGAGLIPHYHCPTWTDMTTIKWSYFLMIRRQQLCESKCGRGWSTSLLPPSFFIPSTSSLLQSKQQVDPYQPSVTATVPHTFLIGPWGSASYAAAAVGSRLIWEWWPGISLGSGDWGPVISYSQSGEANKTSGLRQKNPVHQLVVLFFHVHISLSLIANMLWWILCSGMTIKGATSDTLADIYSWILVI